MRRRLNNLVAAFSLLICVLTLALWARSRWRTDVLTVVRVDDETIPAFRDCFHVRGIDLVTTNGRIQTITVTVDVLKKRMMSDERVPMEDPELAKIFGPMQYRPYALEKDGHWMIRSDFASKDPTLYCLETARESRVTDGDEPKRTEIDGAGFHFGLEQCSGPGMRRGMIYTCTILPLPAVASLTAFYPAIFGWRWWRRRHKTNDLPVQPCNQCGYSLVGNLSGICPERGAGIV